MRQVSSREFQKNIGKYIGEASDGEPVIITRHDRHSTVLVPYHQWQKLTFSDPRWRSILDTMSAKYPGKDDHELLTDLLQHWQHRQDNNGSKDAKLDMIYGVVSKMNNALLWVARKLGYEEE